MCPFASRNSLNPLVLAFCHGGGRRFLTEFPSVWAVPVESQDCRAQNRLDRREPIPPRSGSENRVGLRNVVQNLVQLRAAEAPIVRLGACLIH
jgi:hypothetical protein